MQEQLPRPNKEKLLGCRAETRLTNHPSRQRHYPQQHRKKGNHSPPDNRFKSPPSATPSRSTT